MKGKVGKFEFEFLSPPRGPSGTTHVELADKTKMEVRWRHDDQGIWIETDHGFFGYDIAAETTDDGGRVHQVTRRGAEGAWAGLSFSRAGDAAAAAAAGGAKKGVRVRAQMPGKIIRIGVQPGASVEKGQSILVMEAMKMENEIKAPQSGRVGAIKVTEGQAVETGADLCVIEPV